MNGRKKAVPRREETFKRNHRLSELEEMSSVNNPPTAEQYQESEATHPEQSSQRE
jgi:hypothetical protein